MSFITQAFDEGTAGISRREIMDEVVGEIRKCEKDFSNVLSCYDTPKLRDLMQTLQQLEDVDHLRDVCSQPGFGEQSKDDQLDAVAKAARQSFEKIFITLLDRGSLHRLLVAEPTDEAEAEVVRMRQDVRDYESEQRELQQQAAAIAAEPAPVVVDPVDQCVADFHALGSAQFKAKYLNNQHGREHYNQAIAAGRI